MKQASPQQDPDIRKILEEMKSLNAGYPEELLSARRAAFMDQLAELDSAKDEGQVLTSSQDQKVINLLKGLRFTREKYPEPLLAARRASFKRRIGWVRWLSPWITLRLAVQDWYTSLGSGVLSVKMMRTSLLVAGLTLAVMMGLFVSADRNPTMEFASAGDEVPDTIFVIVTTGTPEVKVDCKPGYKPPLCLTGEFENSNDLTLPENGPAKPAVAKDTIPGFGGIHRASHVNDGQYGPGASWVSNSENSWIKIDLGKSTSINTVAFGRDRLGKMNDRDPGQFVIALAMSDDVYANGISSNDELEYKDVYDSRRAGFNGQISGPETVMAQFKPHTARFIKITFENEGTAIDEVEVFMAKPPVAMNSLANPTKEKRSEERPTLVPTRTFKPISTGTSAPTFTSLPTNTYVPTDTSTPLPTNTHVPTDTSTPLPTDTPVPTDTSPPPTNTPDPTHTSPPPTNTPVETEPPAINPLDLSPTPWPPGLEIKLTHVPSDP